MQHAGSSSVSYVMSVRALQQQQQQPAAASWYCGVVRLSQIYA